MSENLWGELPPPGPSSPPTRILEEQAELLGPLTGNVLEGAVRTVGFDRSERIESQLRIVVPALDGYSIGIVSVDYHPAKSYPLTIRDEITESEVFVANEPDYRKTLGIVLQSSEVRKVISQLLSNAQFSEQLA